MSDNKYRKLELSWFNKDKTYVWDDSKKEYRWVPYDHVLIKEIRLLKEKKNYGTIDSKFDEEQKKWIPTKKGIKKTKQNLLIKGDNLLALKALEHDFTGQIKLIYIDPPFNTGTRIDSDGEEIGYDDGIEHSIWLSMMKNRLETLWKLLSKDGSIFVHISDVEEHYLRCLLDEIFGRSNFINRITVRTKSPSGFQSVNPGVFETAEYILSYAKNKKEWKYKTQFTSTGYDTNYNRIILNKDMDPKKWKIVPLSEFVAKKLGFKDSKDAKKKLHKLVFQSAIEEHATEHANSVFRFTEISDTGAGRETVELKKKSLKTKQIFVQKRKNYPDRYIYQGQEISFYKKKIREIDGEFVPSTQMTNIWTDISWEGIANEGNVTFKKGKKPEKLLRRIIDMASNVGDYVLDSFAGSGTSGAVAHKMGRHWIMIEMGKHAETHCIPRLEAVMGGKDQDKHAYDGGFRYYSLAKSLFSLDEDGMKQINFDNGDLIEAICVNEGFAFVGREFLDKTKIHGVVNGKRFCHIAEELVTQAYVDDLSNEIKADETLVIYCSKKMSNLELPDNIEVKKIPRDISARFSFE